MSQISKWISDEPKLQTIIKEIEASNQSPIKQSEIALIKICDLYNLPKKISDLDSEKRITNSRSVWEEFIILKYLANNVDPRTIMINAIYNVKNKKFINLNEVVLKGHGKIPTVSFVGIKGKTLNAKIIFANDYEEGYEKGCEVVYKIIKYGC